MILISNLCYVVSYSYLEARVLLNDQKTIFSFFEGCELKCFYCFDPFFNNFKMPLATFIFHGSLPILLFSKRDIHSFCRDLYHGQFLAQDVMFPKNQALTVPIISRTFIRRSFRTTL
jgi:hypothetical protein